MAQGSSRGRRSSPRSFQTSFQTSGQTRPSLARIAKTQNDVHSESHRACRWARTLVAAAGKSGERVKNDIYCAINTYPAVSKKKLGTAENCGFLGRDFDLLHCFVREQTHRPLFAAHKPLFAAHKPLFGTHKPLFPKTASYPQSGAQNNAINQMPQRRACPHRMPHVRGCPESSHRQRAGAGSGLACGSPLALEASRAFRRSYCGKLGGGGFAAIREADACRPRRTLTLQERAERSESAAAAEAETGTRRRAGTRPGAGGGTGGPRETVRDGGRPVRRHPPAQRCPRGPGERRHRGPGEGGFVL